MLLQLQMTITALKLLQSEQIHRTYMMRSRDGSYTMPNVETALTRIDRKIRFLPNMKKIKHKTHVISTKNDNITALSLLQNKHMDRT